MDTGLQEDMGRKDTAGWAEPSMGFAAGARGQPERVVPSAVRASGRQGHDGKR